MPPAGPAPPPAARWEAHQHLVGLLGPALALPLLAGLVAAAVTLVPPDRGWLRLAVAAAGLVALVVLVVAPLVRWAAYRLVLTPEWVAVRTGALRRRERAVPLALVAEVRTVQSALGRVLGHGDLLVLPAEGPPLRAERVPRVRRVQALVLECAEAAGAVGTSPPQDDEA